MFQTVQVGKRFERDVMLQIVQMGKRSVVYR